MVQVGQISLTNKNKINSGPTKRFIAITNYNKKRTMMSIQKVVVCSVVVFHLMNCCNWVLAGDEVDTSEGDDTELNYGTAVIADSPFFEWSPSPQSFRSDPKWFRFNGVNGVSPFMMKNKRAVYGIFGLATKRPHKTASEIQYLPPPDSFMSVRGRKKRSLMSSSLFSPNAPFDIRRRKAEHHANIDSFNGVGTNGDN